MKTGLILLAMILSFAAGYEVASYRKGNQTEQDKIYNQVWKNEFESCVAEGIPVYGEKAKQKCTDMLSGHPEK